MLGGGSQPLFLLWVNPPVRIWGCLAPQGCQERGHKCPHPHPFSAQTGRDVRTCERHPAGRGGCLGAPSSVCPLLPQVHVGVNSRKSLSCVRLFATPWAIQSMEFSRLEYCMGSLSHVCVSECVCVS